MQMLELLAEPFGILQYLHGLVTRAIHFGFSND